MFCKGDLVRIKHIPNDFFIVNEYEKNSDTVFLEPKYYTITDNPKETYTLTIKYNNRKILLSTYNIELIRTDESFKSELFSNCFYGAIEEIIKDTIKRIIKGNIEQDELEKWKSRENIEFSMATIDYDDYNKIELAANGNIKNIVKKNKEDNMLKILEMYKEKKQGEIVDVYDKKITEVVEQDEIQQILKEAYNKINIYIEEKGTNPEINSLKKEELDNIKRILLYSFDTDKKIHYLECDRNEKMNIVSQNVKEIQALLELAPNYEEKINILRDYEIIDKKKNVIL